MTSMQTFCGDNYEDEAQKRLVATRLKRSGIPAEYKHATVTDVRLLEWMQTGSYGLIIHGLNGRGKTWQACGLLNAFAQGKTVRFTSLRAIFEDLTTAWNTYTMTEQDVMDSYRNTGVLVLDDLGREKFTPKLVELLFEVVNGRMERQKPTIITTNDTGRSLVLRLQEIDANTGKALASRFSRYQFVEITGDDLRLCQQTMQNSVA